MPSVLGKAAPIGSGGSSQTLKHSTHSADLVSPVPAELAHSVPVLEDRECTQFPGEAGPRDTKPHPAEQKQSRLASFPFSFFLPPASLHLLCS